MSKSVIPADQRAFEAYYFARPFGFRLDGVVMREPVTKTAGYVGTTNLFGLKNMFGTMPVSYNGASRVSGTLLVTGEAISFIGPRVSRVIPLQSVVYTEWYDNGDCQLHHAEGVTLFQGSVRAPICGALVQIGRLGRDVVTFIPNTTAPASATAPWAPPRPETVLPAPAA